MILYHTLSPFNKFAFLLCWYIYILHRLCYTSNFYTGGSQISHEELYGIMAKTLQLFEMGFSENEISSAVDKLGNCES